ncbi:SCO family protein [Capnocytophaga stomatis]|uniref:SCO family protein n=1 Tax=Capnocytophaga stomatis TaxID=1848904 RepID=UPI001AD0EFBA|nr:SCO family protein [Capnocytophaga stomatis]GIM50111.1 photosynthetic protein synthase II [Capnocytophaga stomatis]
MRRKLYSFFALCTLLFLVSCSDSKLVTIGKAPEFSFTNQNNQTISNKDYKGKVYVVDFFFTTCPTICPIMTSSMVKVQNALEGKNVGFASFSINPENDTPEVLKEYAKQHGITSPNWHLLTGDEEAIYDLANNGFNLHAQNNAKGVDGFEHSGLFALIDQKGNIVSRKDADGNPMIYYNGLEDKQIEMLIEDIKLLIGMP